DNESPSVLRVNGRETAMRTIQKECAERAKISRPFASEQIPAKRRHESRRGMQKCVRHGRYSWRKATAGSTLTARRAGPSCASSAIEISSSAPAAKAGGWVGLTP